MLNTRNINCIHWWWQFLLCICTVKPTVQKWERCNLFALTPRLSSGTYRLGDFTSPGDFLSGFGLDNGAERSQADISTQLHRQTRCGRCTSLEWGQTCPRTVSLWPSRWTSNNSNYRHKTTSIKTVCFSFFPKVGTLKLQNFIYLLFQQWNTTDLKLCFSLKLFGFLLNTARNSIILVFPVFQFL